MRETYRKGPIDRDRQREASSGRKAKIENEKKSFSYRKGLSSVYLGR